MSTILNYLRFFLLLILFIDNLNAQPASASYSNLNNSLHPTSFEACLGDTVTFTYTNLRQHPDTIQLNDNTGRVLDIPLSTTTHTVSNSSSKNGVIMFAIPSNAATGNVKLIRNSGAVVYNFNNNLIIHSPSINFHLPQAPFCATDTIPLIGVPTGGTFSSTLSNLIDTSNNTLIGMNAGWTVTTNDSIKDISITYTYTPKYISGISCPNSISTSDTVRIRDNRLSELIFNPIITDDIHDIGNRVSLHIDSPVVKSISPNLSSRNYPISFYGNYLNQINGVDSFFADLAGYSNNSITMQYNNGGCIGNLTADLNVLPPIQLSGLVDTLCNEADLITITRDSNYLYQYRADTTITIGSSYYPYYDTIKTIVEYNIINSVYMQNPSYSSALNTVNSTRNQEEYTFDPNVPALNGLSRPVIKMDYIASRTTTIHIHNSNNYYSPHYPSSYTSVNPEPYTTSSIDYPIELVSRPILNFTIDSSYCKNAAIVYLAPTPAFQQPFSSFSYTVSDSASGSVFLLPTTLPNDQFDANSIYSQALPIGTQNRDLHVQLAYNIDRYGCVDSDTQNTRIIQPIAFNLFLDPPPIITGYCNNATPIKLRPINTTTNVLGVGKFLVDNRIDSLLIDSTDHFLPSRAQSQDYDISYQFTDASNCVSTSLLKVISIREQANIQLHIDSNFIDPKICANTSHVLLKTKRFSGSPSTSITYSSTDFVISGDTLKPYETYNNNNVNGSITRNITVNYRDSFSCITSDDLQVEIYKPLPRMTGFLGTPNNGLYNYCNNKSPFPVIETPSHSSGDLITGSGVFLDTNGVYFYYPDSIILAPLTSFLIDTVRYTYADALGCSNTVESIVQIDSIPDVSLNNLDTSYCVNNASVQLIGLPLPNTANSTAAYNGPGVNTQGVFSPATAGIGQKNIIYSFEDGNGCQNSISKTTTIRALPNPLFNFPQSQYCVSDARFPLNQNSPTGTYTFWGSIIDSVNILNPQDTTGQQTVFYALTDSLGCTDTNSTIIFINPLPVITVTGLDAAYCFNSSRDNILISPAPTTLQEISGSSSGFSLDPNGVTFKPNNDSSGIKLLKYTYTNSTTTCSDSIALNTTIYDVPVLSYTGIDSTYCAIDSFYSIEGTPSGGIFSGVGISDTGSQYYFNPAYTGGGNRTLNYKVDSTILHGSSDTLLCSVEKDINVLINALPTLNFNGPSDNHRFCSNEADTLLEGLASTPTWHLFTSNSLGAIDRNIDTTHHPHPTNPNLLMRVIDTSYYFSPDSAGSGTHYITYSATDSSTGCQDSIKRTYHITNYGNGASFQLKAAYCASNDSIPLSGNPNGGDFYRNQDSLASHFLDLNTLVTLLDTIIYKVTYDACMASDTQFVTVNHLTSLSFNVNKPSKTYCIGEKDPLLIPSVPNGTFSGNAVINGDSSFFSLQYANIGKTLISYTYTDTATSCESIVTDSLFVYHMPNLDFNVVGGCQSDTIFFQPNNDILNLDPRDNITSVQWKLDTAFVPGNSISDNKIDSIHHIFNSPGIYYTKLLVANQTYCVDTTTVRVVISPTVTSNEFPYDETFENSDGDWYAEAKDASHDSLWQWGTDANITGDNIWVTKLNGQYTADEAAWVYSPCFDISSLERPMIRFDRWSDSRDRGDGSVLEFQNLDGTWSPLGELDRGINWFNAGFIAGSPGDQSNQALSPIGWSGQSKKWVNSRYKLDEFKNTANSKLRLRMAFGSSNNDLTAFHNGFAFDNVWIGNRTRNVLLETTSNFYEQNMNAINNHVYQLVYHSPVNKDVILLQYHSGAPNDIDEFHEDNRRVTNARTLFYGIYDAGRAFVDGLYHTESDSLNNRIFEQNMLEDPIFKVVIDTFYHSNQPSEFTLTATVTALVDISSVEGYRINMVITEDSLSYTNDNRIIVHAVVREDDSKDTINTFARSWVAGDHVTFTERYSLTNLNYVPNHFQAVVFIQAQLDSAREVFQAATTRDISGYWVGPNVAVDQIASEKELNEIKDMMLYPNPAKDYINIDFPQLLEKDYNWKLISIGGVTVKEGVIYTGEQTLHINNYDLPAGVYIFMVHNDNVYSQRKVIINQN